VAIDAGDEGSLEAKEAVYDLSRLVIALGPACVIAFFDPSRHVLRVAARRKPSLSGTGEDDDDGFRVTIDIDEYTREFVV
jgi:hypothetical protein